MDFFKIHFGIFSRLAGDSSRLFFSFLSGILRLCVCVCVCFVCDKVPQTDEKKKFFEKNHVSIL